MTNITKKLPQPKRLREFLYYSIPACFKIAIKVPFLIEGSFIGLFGSIIPIILMAYGYKSFYDYLGGQLFSSSLGKLVQPYPFILYSSLLLLVIGLLVGMFGSSRAVRKYLKI